MWGAPETRQRTRWEVGSRLGGPAGQGSSGSLCTRPGPSCPCQQPAESAACQELGSGWACEEQNQAVQCPGNIPAWDEVTGSEVLGTLCLGPRSGPPSLLSGSSGKELDSPLLKGYPEIREILRASSFTCGLEVQELERTWAAAQRLWLSAPFRQDLGLQLPLIPCPEFFLLLSGR